jgi:hypothetical protein
MRKLQVTNSSIVSRDCIVAVSYSRNCEQPLPFQCNIQVARAFQERRGSATAGASVPARPTSSSQFRGPLARRRTPQQAAECTPRRTVKKIVSQLFLWNTHFLCTWNSARRSPSRKGIKEETDRQPGWMGLNRVSRRAATVCVRRPHQFRTRSPKSVLPSSFAKAIMLLGGA